jgi:hypothetical protein
MLFVKAKWSEKDLHLLLRNAGGDGTRKRNSGKYLTEILLQSALRHGLSIKMVKAYRYVCLNAYGCKGLHIALYAFIY